MLMPNKKPIKSTYSIETRKKTAADVKFDVYKMFIFV